MNLLFKPLFLTSCILCWLLCSCASERIKVVTPVKEWHGYSCGIKNSTNKVIASMEEWKALWERLNTQNLFGTLPPVDFNQHMALAVFKGECKSGGHDILMKKIVWKKKKEIMVQVKEESPSAGIMTITMMTPTMHKI
jgi:hypothetical protein